MPAFISAKLKTWLSLVFFVLAAMLVFINWLPELAEQFLFPPFLQKSGLTEYQVSVYRLGMNGCTLRVSGKQGSGAIITAGNVQLDWSLSGLLERRLDRLILHGLRINYSPDGQGNGSSSTMSSSKIKDHAGRAEEQTALQVLPLIVDQIQVIDSFVAVQNAMGVQRVPFSVSAQRIYDEDIRKKNFTLRYTVHAEAAGQEVFADIFYGALKRSLSGVVTGSISLQKLAREFAGTLPFPVDIKGNAEVTVQAEMRVAPFTLENLQIEAHLKDPLVVEHDALRINAEHLGVEAHVLFDAQKNPSLTSTLLLSGDDLGVTAPGLRFTVPRAQLGGEGAYLPHNNDQKYTFSGKLEFADALLVMDEQEVVLQGIGLEFPGTWPMSVNRHVGVLQIQNILLRNIGIGHFSGTWDQSPHAIILKGELQSEFLPESRVALSGIFRVPGPGKPLADFRIETADARISLSRFTPLFPILEPLAGEGLLNMEGRVAVYPGRITSKLQVDFVEGDLEIIESGLKAEGVSLYLDFPDLPNWYTSPQQKLSIDSIINKELVVTDLKSSFRLESLQSLFVEKVSAHWSKGRIFTSSFRLQKDSPDFEAALFCDRLELSEILSQLGLAQAEGSGSLSGRVPIRFSDGKLYVDDGFLYTAPGEKGILKIKKSEHLMAGIPVDVPQFSPLYFASAALRDFEYNWAKLHVLSDELDLILKLQIDGKPGERLPFRFDQQKNVFVRLEEGSPGGIDRPVKLDINFKVPVNELFRYQQQLMPILRKIR